jgi:hypothetical protein
MIMLLLPKDITSYLNLNSHPCQGTLEGLGEPHRREWTLSITWQVQHARRSGVYHEKSVWLSSLLADAVELERILLHHLERPKDHVFGVFALHIYYPPALWQSINYTLKRWYAGANLIRLER